MNPRYLAYCRAHGMASDKMMEADEAAYPGGPMAGYSVWISAQYSVFRRLFRKVGNFSKEDYEKFDRWLAAK